MAIRACKNLPDQFSYCGISYLCWPVDCEWVESVSSRSWAGRLAAEGFPSDKADTVYWTCC